MKRLSIFIILLSISCFQYSCKKETIVYATTADQVILQLQKVIKDNGITKIIAWDDRGGFPSTISPTLGVFWTFSNGFITIEGYGFDSKFTRSLSYLDYYDIVNVLVTDGTNPQALIIHFRT